MDKKELSAFQIDITTQLALIEATMSRLDDRANQIEVDDPGRLESAAYQLHNLYNAVEDLLELVATYFENHVTDSSRWHTELLYRMTQPIPGVRPALLSEESYQWLNSLRGFRHFFRHAYSMAIDYPQLQLNITKTQQTYPRFKQDVANFLQQISRTS